MAVRVFHVLTAIFVFKEDVMSIKIRRTWKIKPITKVKVSKKIYKRNKEKDKVKRDLYEI